MPRWTEALRGRGGRGRMGIALLLLATFLVTACGGAPASAPAAPASAATPAADQGNASSSTTPRPASTATQSSTGGQVTIQVTWSGPASGPVFEVAMNTHSVELDGYDLRQLAVLRTDTGLEVTPTGWDAPPGGHHRQGRLTFPTTTAAGTPLLTGGARTLELVIRNVAGVPDRSFAWSW